MRARANYIAIANDIGASDKALALPEQTYLSAIGLLVLCIAYCDRQRTDGRIPASAIKRAIAPGVECDTAIAELLRVGWLHEREDGFDVADYLAWQRSKSEIEAAIEQRRAAGALGGKARASKNKDQEIDKTPTTDKSALPRSLGEPPSEPPSEPLDADEAGEVREAARNKITREEALPLIEQYGRERCVSVARHIIANPPTEGIKSMSGLMRHLLERGGGERAETRRPKPRPCFACEGTGKRTENGQRVVCEVCGGEGR